MNFDITYQQYGEKAILISWPSIIDDLILEDIVSVKKIIIEDDKIVLLDITNGYNTLLLLYKDVFDIVYEIDHIKMIIALRNQKRIKRKISKWTIPVCYHASFGIDLKALTIDKDMEVEEVISLHTTPDYKVFCKGFLPGFMYLGGLDPKLYSLRKSTPRLKIPKNSVAIGGKQTGIYPSESPGGWQIIGRTPIVLFDIRDKELSSIKLGDTIKFEEISLANYIAMESKNLKLIPEIEY